MPKSTEFQYKGFLNTPAIWEEGEVLSEQWKIKQCALLGAGSVSEVGFTNRKRLRLGQLVEQFVFHELEQMELVEVLASNVQIRKGKITVGELDGVIENKGTSEKIHLEIVYKFYLYDDSIEGHELDKWIGPNRKDDLVQKLSKLKGKQLPLLYKEETREALNNIGIDADELKQQVLFKAQLFVPAQQMNNDLALVNNDCVAGYYIRYSELKSLNHNEFYIPEKLDWLREPHPYVEWMSFIDFKNGISIQMDEQRSPLCWLKKSNGKMEKFFVVWWQ